MFLSSHFYRIECYKILDFGDEKGKCFMSMTGMKETDTIG